MPYREFSYAICSPIANLISAADRPKLVLECTSSSVPFFVDSVENDDHRALMCMVRSRARGIEMKP